MIIKYVHMKILEKKDVKTFDSRGILSLTKSVLVLKSLRLKLLKT